MYREGNTNKSDYLPLHTTSGHVPRSCYILQCIVVLKCENIIFIYAILADEYFTTILNHFV